MLMSHKYGFLKLYDIWLVPSQNDSTFDANLLLLILNLDRLPNKKHIDFG